LDQKISRQLSSSVSYGRSMLAGQSDNDIRASTSQTLNPQCPAHLFDAFAHSGEPYTIVPIFDLKSITIVAKFQTKFLCFVA
jgi:hypothetical protein